MLVTAEEKEQVIALVTKYIREAACVDFWISRDVARDDKAETGRRLSPGPWSLILKASEVSKAKQEEWRKGKDIVPAEKFVEAMTSAANGGPKK